METDPAFARSHNAIGRKAFRDALDGAIDAAIGSAGARKDHSAARSGSTARTTARTKASVDPQSSPRSNAETAHRYAKLATSIRAGRFALTDERIERTLSFLTHSGWAYWDRKLFKGRVIIGQQWALTGIYTVLDGRKESPIRRALTRVDGRFTRSELGTLAWNAAYAPDEQKLLLSFMERCGLCFKLRSARDSWGGEGVYISVEHLPTAGELGFERLFGESAGEGRRQDASQRDPAAETTRATSAITINAPRMHTQHWQALLIDAGRHYGKDAAYALDGLYVRNIEGEKLLIRCDLDHANFRGTIEIRMIGPRAAERIEPIAAWVRGFLPDAGATAGDAGTGRRPSDGERATAASVLPRGDEPGEVFISYTWDPPKRKGESGIPAGYEVPVDAIESFLGSHGVLVMRDKSQVKRGDTLRDFMVKGARSPRVIVVHSDKYWRSPCCIFECAMLLEELQTNNRKGFADVVIAVEHLNSRVTDRTTQEAYAKDWQKYKGYVPAALGWSMSELRLQAPAVVWTFGKQLSNLINLNIRWDDGKEEALEKIKNLLLSSPTPAKRTRR